MRITLNVLSFSLLIIGLVITGIDILRFTQIHRNLDRQVYAAIQSASLSAPDFDALDKEYILKQIKTAANPDEVLIQPVILGRTQGLLIEAHAHFTPVLIPFLSRPFIINYVRPFLGSSP